MKSKKLHHRERPFYSALQWVGLFCFLALYGLLWLKAIAMIRASNYAGYTTLYKQPMGAYQLVIGLVAVGLIVVYCICKAWKKPDTRG